MAKAIQVQETVSPNLIPMIDIMFLLLLFFMLSADMGQRELETVVLPKVTFAKEDIKSGRVTLNVFHDDKVTCEPYGKGKVCREEVHWKVGIKGRDCTDLGKLAAILKKEAATELDSQDPPISERTVMIRADAAAPYGLAQRAMNACAKAGIYRVEVGAARKKNQS
jgi:biopolymer transport protein ExbD